MPARLLEPLCAGWQHPDPQSDSEQARQLFQPPGLDPGHQTILTVCTALPVAPLARRAKTLVRRRRVHGYRRAGSRQERQAPYPGHENTPSLAAVNVGAVGRSQGAELREITARLPTGRGILQASRSLERSATTAAATDCVRSWSSRCCRDSCPHRCRGSCHLRRQTRRWRGLRGPG